MCNRRATRWYSSSPASRSRPGRQAEGNTWPIGRPARDPALQRFLPILKAFTSIEPTHAVGAGTAVRQHGGPQAAPEEVGNRGTPDHGTARRRAPRRATAEPSAGNHSSCEEFRHALTQSDDHAFSHRERDVSVDLYNMIEPVRPLAMIAVALRRPLPLCWRPGLGMTAINCKDLDRCGPNFSSHWASCSSVSTGATARCGDFVFSTGDPDGLMAMATRPSGNGKIEIESADDFILTQKTAITNVTFTGLLTGGANAADISQVVVEIYRVFPLDSTVPPSGNVPTRNNSPSDVALDSRDSSAGGLTFATSTLATTFVAGNSVLNGINKVPNQTTMGEGPVTGQEVAISTALSLPFTLSAGHYFLVPQVLLSSASSEFYWLSAPRPIPGAPFTPDLQTWIRNENLAPDWLRVGTDIEGTGRTFNASFTISGSIVPEPSSIVLAAIGLVVAVVSSSVTPRARAR